MSYRKPFRVPEDTEPVKAGTLEEGDVLVLAGHTIEVMDVELVGKRHVLVTPDIGRVLRYRQSEDVQVVRKAN